MCNQEPDIVATLGLLSHLNNEELKELLNDDDKFEEIVKDVKQFKEQDTEKEMLLASNRSMAEFNLSNKPKLEDGKQAIRELSEKGSKLCTSVMEKLDQLKEQSGTMTVDTALALLQASAAEIEEESEKIQGKFMNEEMEVDEFLEQFLTRRKLMHLRKVKVDKMKELMLKPRPSSSGILGYPTSGNFPGMGPSVPYPTGVIGMPMPVPPVYRPY
ncbi:vacuolar protein sorting-associated protein 37B isoform X1 [Diprion similis]|uniref:vacuolar protein sorting-associated protein 37B isoform X1 n=1 Tax=Diprion similis TaxID=362088 RepID=UPI001EF92F74|nr:vacuolar protein sorting-associated protein 37B isoform X1 [Diprion similis]